MEQFGILEDFDDHTGAEERRGGPDRTDGGLQLGQTGFLLLGILADLIAMKGTSQRRTMAARPARSP